MAENPGFTSIRRSRARGASVLSGVALFALGACSTSSAPQPELTIAGEEIPLACLRPADQGGYEPTEQRVTLTRDGGALIATVDLADASLDGSDADGRIEFDLRRYREDQHPEIRATDGMRVSLDIPASWAEGALEVTPSVTMGDQSIDTTGSTISLTEAGYVLRVEGAGGGFDVYAAHEDDADEAFARADLTEVSNFRVGVGLIRCGTGYVGTDEGFLSAGELACMTFDAGRPQTMRMESLGSFVAHEDGSVTLTRHDTGDQSQVLTDVPGLGVELAPGASLTLHRETDRSSGYRDFLTLQSPPVFCSTAYVPTPSW